jgi:hypothetical protein
MGASSGIERSHIDCRSIILAAAALPGRASTRIPLKNARLRKTKRFDDPDRSDIVGLFGKDEHEATDAENQDGCPYDDNDCRK